MKPAGQNSAFFLNFEPDKTDVQKVHLHRILQRSNSHKTPLYIGGKASNSCLDFMAK